MYCRSPEIALQALFLNTGERRGKKNVMGKLIPKSKTSTSVRHSLILLLYHIPFTHSWMSVGWMWYAFRGVLQKENPMLKQKLGRREAIFPRKGVRRAEQGKEQSKDVVSAGVKLRPDSTESWMSQPDIPHLLSTETTSYLILMYKEGQQPESKANSRSL